MALLTPYETAAPLVLVLDGVLLEEVPVVEPTPLFGIVGGDASVGPLEDAAVILRPEVAAVDLCGRLHVETTLDVFEFRQFRSAI